MDFVADHLLAIVLLVFGLQAMAVVVWNRRDRRRTRQYETSLTGWAAAHGWDHVARDDHWHRPWRGAPFETRYTARSEDVMRGPWGRHRGVAVNLSYTTTGPSGRGSRYCFAVVGLALPTTLPWVLVRPAKRGDRMAERFGRPRFRTGDAGFDRAFRVETDDEAFARRFLHPATVAALTGDPRSDLRLSGDHLLRTRPGSLDVSDIETWLDHLARIAESLPRTAGHA